MANTILSCFWMVAFIKMLVYEKIDILDRIDVDMSDKSKECMLGHYWYFFR